MNNKDYKKTKFEAFKRYKNTTTTCSNYECNVFNNCLLKDKEIERLKEDISNYIKVVLHDRNEIERLNKIIKYLLDNSDEANDVYEEYKKEYK